MYGYGLFVAFGATWILVQAVSVFSIWTSICCTVGNGGTIFDCKTVLVANFGVHKRSGVAFEKKGCQSPSRKSFRRRCTGALVPYIPLMRQSYCTLGPLLVTKWEPESSDVPRFDRGEGRAELSLGLIVETPSHQQRYLETVSLINLLSCEECACVWTRLGRKDNLIKTNG